MKPANIAALDRNNVIDMMHYTSLFREIFPFFVYKLELLWGVTSLEIIAALNIDWKDRIKICCRIVEDRLMHFTWNKFAICLSQYGIAGIQLIHWKIRSEHHAIGAELI